MQTFTRLCPTLVHLFLGLLAWNLQLFGKTGAQSPMPPDYLPKEYFLPDGTRDPRHLPQGPQDSSTNNFYDSIATPNSPITTTTYHFNPRASQPNSGDFSGSSSSPSAIAGQPQPYPQSGSFNYPGQNFRSPTQSFDTLTQNFNREFQSFNQDNRNFNPQGQGFNLPTQNFNPPTSNFNPPTSNFNPPTQNFIPPTQPSSNSNSLYDLNRETSKILSNQFGAKILSPESLASNKRSRRRLKLRRLPKNYRPPKEYIIYSLPEQSFWAARDDDLLTQDDLDLDEGPSENDIANSSSNNSSNSSTNSNSTTTINRDLGDDKNAKLDRDQDLLSSKKNLLGQCMKHCIDALL